MLSEQHFVIQELVTYGHSQVTHPECVREEILVSHLQRPFLIGHGGREVQKIKDIYSVRVVLPEKVDHDGEAMTFILGKASSVAKAKAHITKLLADVEPIIKKKLEEQAAKEAAEADEKDAAAEGGDAGAESGAEAEAEARVDDDAVQWARSRASGDDDVVGNDADDDAARAGEASDKGEAGEEDGEDDEDDEDDEEEAGEEDGGESEKAEDEEIAGADDEDVVEIS